ncbi:MAG: 5'-nucleotidase C-terminal domain-containing protein [Bacteroidales bacterium]
MRKKLFNYSLPLIALAAVVSCNAEKSKLTYLPDESQMILVTDSLYEEDPEMAAIINPYKLKMDSIMNEVVGYSSETMDSRVPESALPQFVLNIMRTQAEKLTGEKVDIALVNLGGLRSSLYKGDVTIGTIYSIFPFENALTLIDVKGRDLKALYEVINNRKRLAATILPDIKDDQTYRVATIDYLVDGNDNASPLKSASNRKDTGLLLRDVIIDYYRTNNTK